MNHSLLCTQPWTIFWDHQKETGSFQLYTWYVETLIVLPYWQMKQSVLIQGKGMIMPNYKMQWLFCRQVIVKLWMTGQTLSLESLWVKKDLRKLVCCILSISYLACIFSSIPWGCAKICWSEYLFIHCDNFISLILLIIFNLFPCRPVESRGIHQNGTMGEMVTYRYYVGRLNMFEDQYELAEENFDYALKHCHRSAVGNKKRILNYLVPVKLLRGRLPTSRCKSQSMLVFVMRNYDRF